ncbi:synaptonemal complex protein 2-like [Erinaceus europaeus]|uniref:Synaptonemal complex protein 2-like n=1 Tax=Erinaceus europaeus TaxID=9365 RepID=A0ABM3XD82_ERIEU|nr:synaptonemal complex protein 2-like [Erinaceus europaeus]
MASWFERVAGFLTVGDLALDTSLWNVMDDFFDTALVISTSSSKGRTQMLDSFLLTLGSLVTEKTVHHQIQREVLRTLNSILHAVPCQERRQLPLSEEWARFMNDLARTVLTEGDYDQQITLCETLCRLTTKRSRSDFVQQWFEDNTIADAFKKIKDPEFDTDGRLFLNYLNNRLGDQRRVYSFPCIAAFADGHEMKKPADEKLEKFWIDFNEGSQSITFYIANTESVLWDPVRLSKEAVANFSIIETTKKKRLIINLEKPIRISNREVMKVEIHFDLQFNISQASVRAFGEDKQMLPDQTEMSSEHLMKFENGQTKVPTNCEKETGEAEEATELAESRGAGYDRCLITLSLSDLNEFNQVNTADRSPEELELKETHRGKTSESEGSDSSDLQESSVKIQTPTLYEKSKAHSASKGDRRQEKQMSFNYRKHIFLENDHSSSSETSEQSWINNQKWKSLTPYPGRKKTTKSKLRILPLFLSSSGSDHEKDQPKLVTPPGKYTYKQNNAKPSKVSRTQLQSGSSVLTPGDSGQKTDLQSPPQLGELSSLEHSEVEENVSETVNQESLMKHKHKLQTLEDSADDSSAEWKKSKLEEGDALGSIPLMTEETDLEELTSESANDSALILAFENFTGELKRRFQLKQERSLLYSNTAQQIQERLKRLLSKIHQWK